MQAIVVLSGGQDSVTCLAWAMRQNYEKVHAITFNYQQRHSREIQCAAAAATLLGASSHEIVTLGPILKGRSPLVSNEELERYESFEQMDKIIGDRVELTFVPMRNALFLTLAANRGAVLAEGAFDLVTGVCEDDNANYPDCRATFIGSMESMIGSALDRYGVSIKAPLLYNSKKDSVMMLWNMGVRSFATLAFSHTAYDGSFPPVGTDHASVLRAHGFEMAGLPDPMIIRAMKSHGYPIPQTANYQDHPLNDLLWDEILLLKKELHGPLFEGEQE